MREARSGSLIMNTIREQKQSTQGCFKYQTMEIITQSQTTRVCYWYWNCWCKHVMVFLCGKTVQIKRKKNHFRGCLKFRFLQAEFFWWALVCLSDTGWKSGTADCHPRLGEVCCGWWSCYEEQGISDPEAGGWGSHRRISLACTASWNGKLRRECDCWL